MEISEKLRASKQQLRSAQEEYRNHLYWVDKTRGGFVFVQKEQRKVKARSSQICQAHSRSCSPESDDTQEATVMRKRKESRNTLANGDSRIDDNISCRLDLLLSEELKGQEARTDRKDNDDSDNYSDSLLASVMREVALIEEKHNSLISFNRRLKKRSRGFHKSVIITKRERLNYDVSAEDSAMSKEENLRSRHMKTNMLSKEVRKLKRNLKNLQIDEKAITSRINHDLEAVREDEVLEGALRKGRLGVQQLREESGRLLLESRQEAKRFASRVRILDLGEWLLRRTYVTTPVGQVYSRLRGADTSDSVHIADLIDPNGQQPPIIVLSGPKGSGKTCMAHYLLQQWESNTEAIKSNIHKFDLVVYGTVGNILSSGTWAQYLREHIFYLTLVDFPEVEIFGALNTMSVLYLLDLDTTTPSISKILDDVFGNVGNNHVVLTTRPDGEDPIARAAKRHNIKYQRVRMCPMTSNAIQEYSTNLLSLVEQDDSVVSNKVKQFSRFVSSMKTTDEVLYPLPLAYLLHLWRANPRHAQQATSVSRLIYHVIFEAESSFLGSLLATDSKDKEAARIRVEQCTKRLYEAAWECVIRALATCSSTFVHLRQDSKFYAWGKTETSDALIMPLQPPGTLQEFWGHLGVEGGLALRHFHHLVELNVRVSSCEALKSLVYSIGYIRRSLQYLYLRLDLPASTPVSDIEPLKFKGKNLWLRIRGVEDENLSWVKEITAKLSDWYTGGVRHSAGHSAQVFAEDLDGSAVNSKVVFRIQHGAQDKFVMDADTGVISVAQGAVLDPDRTEPRATTYVLEVLALDGGIGGTQLQASTVVNITIRDVNNKPPVFVDPGTVR
ncbi:Cadherin-23 [Chionoecetes opilio]|uniref:Cadherin-23 n=1 Tax=Chionoecetes opilio TaxID=41210 RepID=A0A8J4XTT5_CHIOP|nr:Cadherin-23 [Chionoecetes opilio]